MDETGAATHTIDNPSSAVFLQLEVCEFIDPPNLTIAVRTICPGRWSTMRNNQGLGKLTRVFYWPILLAALAALHRGVQLRGVVEAVPIDP